MNNTVATETLNTNCLLTWNDIKHIYKIQQIICNKNKQLNG